jgi:DNA-binding response OmpR family regulator
MAGAQRSRKQKILVADESITIQKLVHLTFAGTSYEIVVASDGHDAFTKAKRLKPDFVLADCRLRELDGLKLCEAIRKESTLSGTKVILMKSAADKVSSTQSIEAGADDLLAKPFDSKGLTRIIEKFSQDEESTVVKKLEAIADEVTREAVGSSQVDASEEPTKTERVSPEKSEVSVTAVSDSPFRSRTEETFDTSAFNQMAETQIKDWIEKNLPSIAERLIKEEIARLSQINH